MFRNPSTLCVALKRCAQRISTSCSLQAPPFHVAQNGNVVLIFQTSCVSSVATSEESATAKIDQKSVKSAPRRVRETSSIKYADSAKLLSESGGLSQLLSIAENGTISESMAQEVVRKLDLLVESKAVTVEKLQSDPRYIQLSKLSKGSNISPKQKKVKDEIDLMGAELKTVMKVQSVSKAVEILSSLTTSQKITVLKNLALGSHRNVELLGELCNNIATDVKSLNLKALSDIVFSKTKLSYVNPNLMTAVTSEMVHQLKDNEHAAVVGSAINAYRILQWRDEEFLEAVSQWVQKNIAGFRSPSSLLYALAILNYVPTNHEDLFEIIWDKTVSSSASFNNLVSAVWSLVVLDKASEKHFKFVFDPALLNNIDHGSLLLPTIRKLHNINAAAKLCPDYKGPYLLDSFKGHDVQFSPSSDKKSLVGKLKDILFRKMDPALYHTFYPTDMGFAIDLLCCLKETGEPVPVCTDSPHTTRVAVRTVCYNECCHPQSVPVGVKELEKRLLEKNGYHVITFPYSRFGPHISQLEHNSFFSEQLAKVLGAR